MYQTNLNKRSLRSVLLLGAASAAAVGLSAPASAQDQSVETVVVTGSRIPQQGLYSSSPVTSVGQQEMKLEDTSSIETLLNNLPSVIPDMGSTTSNGAEGTANVNLRGLGDNRTLVLIDGVRLMPGDPLLAAADLDQIPVQMVDHVEVLTGGASAVYGSDAIAGVVNFIMRKDFEGVEFDGGYSVYQHNNDDSYLRGIEAAGQGGTTPGSVTLAPSSVLDGPTTTASILVGVNSPNDKGNITIYAGYKNTAVVYQGARDISACGLGAIYNGTAPDGLGFSGLECIGTVTQEPESVTVPLSGPNAFLGNPYFLPGPLAGEETNTFPPGGFPDADTFNFAPYQTLQRADTRYNAGFFGHYDLSKEVQFYSSFMFMEDNTLAPIGPSGAFFGDVYNTNCSNPLLGTAADPNSAYNVLGCGPANGNPTTVPVLFGARFADNGGRDDSLQHISFRFVEGVKGDLGDGWSYDLYGEHGTTIRNEIYYNDASIPAIQDELLVGGTAANPVCLSGNPGCVPLDLFSPFGPSAASEKYASTNGFAEASTTEDIISGNLTGDLGQYGIQSPWAKNPVAVSIGGEYRQEQLTYTTDPAFAAGDLAGQGGTHNAIHGSFNVTEGFGEIRVPIVQNMPFFEDLSANFAYRYSSYNLQGATNTYNIGLEWQPIDDFRIRASDDHAVRAPNVLELFAPTNQALFVGTDPCAGTAPTLTLTQCERTGVTASEYGHIIPCPVEQCSQQTGGNQSLKPEVSDTRSIGLVFTPTFFDGFTATIDYYDIKVNGAIGVIPQDQVINACATLDQLCGRIQRGPDGILFGNQAFVVSNPINLGSIKTNGVDVEANYLIDSGNLPSSWGMGGLGSLSFNLIGTYTEHFITISYPAFPALGIPAAQPYDCAGLYGPVCLTPDPHWRHKLRTTWSTPWDFDVSLAWRYIGAVALDQNQAPSKNIPYVYGAPVYDSTGSIASWSYFDLAVNWHVRDDIDLTFGVNNILDTNPPALDTTNIGTSALPFGNGNTYPGLYDSLGRLLFVNVTLKN
ncbi:MAG: TonB-dependent receptor [Rhizomicrobium sp.]